MTVVTMLYVAAAAMPDESNRKSNTRFAARNEKSDDHIVQAIGGAAEMACYVFWHQRPLHSL